MTTEHSSTPGVDSGADSAAEDALAEQIAVAIGKTYTDLETTTAEKADTLAGLLHDTSVGVRRLHPVLDQADAKLADRDFSKIEARAVHNTVNGLRRIVDGWVAWEDKIDRVRDLVEEYQRFHEAHKDVEFGDMTETQWVAVARGIALIDEAAKLSADLDVPFPEHVMVAGVQLRVIYDEHTRVQNEQARRDRIAARQAARVDRPPMEGRKCSTCGKKPARVDDLCKVCARAAGIIIHGKVGGS